MKGMINPLPAMSNQPMIQTSNNPDANVTNRFRINSTPCFYLIDNPGHTHRARITNKISIQLPWLIPHLNYHLKPTPDMIKI